MLVEIHLFLCDLAPFIHRVIHTNLFQRQQIRSCIHNPSGHHDRRNVDTADCHQVGRHTLITACDKYSSVKRRGVCVDFHHICHHIPGRKGIIDPIVSLSFPVTDICTEIPRSMSSCPGCPRARLLRQFQQMTAARVAVTERALNDDLWF